MKLVCSWFVLLVCGGGLIGCSDPATPSPTPAEPWVDPDPAGLQTITTPSLFLVGNDRGRIRPCGCSKPLLGGIERRLAFFGQVDPVVREQSVVLGFGNMLESGGRQQELKLEGFLEALGRYPARVYCVGDGDLLVGASHWRDVRPLTEAYEVVSLNVRHRGEALFASHAVVPWQGRRLVVTGYISPTDNLVNEPGVEILADPPVDAVRAALRDGDATSPVLVLFGTGRADEVLAFAERSGLRAAAAHLFVVLTGVSDLPTLVAPDAKTSVVELGQKGRDVARLTWREKPSLTSHTLVEALGRDAVATSILDFYRESIAFEKLLEAVPLLGRAESGYVGSKDCGICHPAAYEVWKDSRHAHAWQSLVVSGDSRDPECVGCHVVDFGVVGGFDPVRNEPVDVQCEACHGPGRDHMKQQKPTPRGKLGRSSCVRCHDLDNSPKFDFDPYWKQIGH